MKVSFRGRLTLFAAILVATADRLPAPISQVETQTATPAKSATSYETRSADLPRMEVAVGKIKDVRASGGEATKMEVEFRVSTNEVLNDVRGFRIAINKATDDTGMDLGTPRSNGREFEAADGLGGGINFKQELKSPHRNAATIHELTGNVELFVPKNDPAATVVVNSFHKHLGTPIDSDILKSAQLKVVVRTAQQYGALRKERQAQQSKAQHRPPAPNTPRFDPMSAVEQEPNNIALSSEGATANLVSFEFWDQTDKPIETKRRLNIYEPDGKRTLIYHFSAPASETTKLVMFVATPEAVVKVPFTLTDVALP